MMLTGVEALMLMFRHAGHPLAYRKCYKTGLIVCKLSKINMKLYALHYVGDFQHFASRTRLWSSESS